MAALKLVDCRPSPSLLSMPPELLESILKKLLPNLKDISRAARTCSYLYSFLPRFLLENSLYLSAFLTKRLSARKVELPLATLGREFYPHPIELTVTLKTQADVENFSALAAKFPNIKSLSIEVARSELFHELAACLASKGQNLSHLKIAGKVNGCDLENVLKSLTMLQSLDLSRCRFAAMLYDRDFNLAIDFASASLSWIRVDPLSFGYHIKPYDTIFTKCPGLEYIQLSHKNLSEKTLQRGNQGNRWNLLLMSIDALGQNIPILHRWGSLKQFSLINLFDIVKTFFRILHATLYQYPRYAQFPFMWVG